MKIVCISDTHNCGEQIRVPDGDLLIHSGDATIKGTREEVERFAQWFSGLPHRHKIFVAGNHDWLFQRNNDLARRLLGDDIVYLQDSDVEIDGLKIYGSPWQPRFYDWAFNLDRGPEIAAKWRAVPDDIDILITHGPPKGILDHVPRADGFDHEGCEELSKRIKEIARTGRLRAHIFGHIHFGHGIVENDGVIFANASICNEDYLPLNPALIIDL